MGNPPTMINYAAVRTPNDIGALRDLFENYANWLATDFGISLEFQGIKEELATLPGKYAPPMGEALLARDENGAAVGCIALRPFDNTRCEIKRLYVTPAARGQSLGKTLIAEILTIAKACKYEEAILDTGKFMPAAQALYEAYGFSDIPPYYDNPYGGVRYMGKKL